MGSNDDDDNGPKIGTKFPWMKELDRIRDAVDPPWMRRMRSLSEGAFGSSAVRDALKLSENQAFRLHWSPPGAATLAKVDSMADDANVLKLTQSAAEISRILARVAMPKLWSDAQGGSAAIRDLVSVSTALAVSTKLLNLPSGLDQMMEVQSAREKVLRLSRLDQVMKGQAAWAKHLSSPSWRDQTTMRLSEFGANLSKLTQLIDKGAFGVNPGLSRLNDLIRPMGDEVDTVSRIIARFSETASTSSAASVMVGLDRMLSPERLWGVTSALQDAIGISTPITREEWYSRAPEARAKAILIADRLAERCEDTSPDEADLRELWKKYRWFFLTVFMFVGKANDVASFVNNYRTFFGGPAVEFEQMRATQNDMRDRIEEMANDAVYRGDFDAFREEVRQSSRRTDEDDCLAQIAAAVRYGGQGRAVDYETEIRTKPDRRSDVLASAPRDALVILGGETHGEWIRVLAFCPKGAAFGWIRKKAIRKLRMRGSFAMRRRCRPRRCSQGRAKTSPLACDW